MATGRFNRLDPFAGNSADPQSLHKYLYTHGDPIHGIDPTGALLAGLTLGGAFRLGLSWATTTFIGRTVTGAVVAATVSAISAALAKDATVDSVLNAAVMGALFAAAFGAPGHLTELGALLVGAGLLVFLAPFIWANVKHDWQQGNKVKAIFDVSLLLLGGALIVTRLSQIAISSATAASAYNGGFYARVAAMMEYARFHRNPSAFEAANGRLPVVAAGAADGAAGESAGALSGAASAPGRWHPVVRALLTQAEAAWRNAGARGRPPGRCAEWRALNALALRMGSRFRLGKNIESQAVGTGQSPKFPAGQDISPCDMCVQSLGEHVTLLPGG